MKNSYLLTGFLALFPALLMADEQPTGQQFPWLDNLHDSIAVGVDDTALWFDEFFIDENQPIDENARGEAKITLAWEPRSRDIMEFDTRFRLRVKLPNLKHKADLVFSDYDEEEQNNPLRSSRNEAVSERNKFNLALRWVSKHDERSDWSHRLGIGRKLQPYVKTRYRRVFEFTEQNNLRWDTSFYYYTRDGFGSHTLFQYEHQLDVDSLMRFDSHFYYRDKENDWIWQHGLYNFKQWDQRTAFICGLYVEGNSRPNYQVSEYLLSTRWRKNALRDWLFFEVEPFVLWRRDEDFKPSYGVALRVEGWFGGV